MKIRILCLSLLFLLALGAVLVIALSNQAAITFESAESQTVEGKAVFNEVRLIQSAKKQTWIMRQSHHGPMEPKTKWDRVVIVVDTSSVPKKAQFFQLEPGQNEFAPDAKRVPYRASCFSCHANGPRVMRPNLDSLRAPLSWNQRLRIAWWNLQIRRLGRVEADTVHDSGHAPVGNTPFRSVFALDNQALRIQECLMCHNDTPGGRGLLTRQNTTTIEFLTQSRAMPPRGYRLSKQSERELRRFLAGF